MERTLRSTVTPLLLVVAAVASFALAGRAPLRFNYSLAWVRDFSILTAGALWLALGIRHIHRDGLHAKTVPFSIAGVLLLVLVGLSSFYAVRTYESAIELLREPDLKKVEKITTTVIADPKSTPEQRSQASTFRARHAFIRTGEILPVVDASGHQSQFEPSDADREQRNAEQSLRVLVPYGAANARRFQLLVGSVALASLVLGVATPARRAPAG